MDEQGTVQEIIDQLWLLVETEQSKVVLLLENLKMLVLILSLFFVFYSPFSS